MKKWKTKHKRVTFGVNCGELKKNVRVKIIYREGWVIIMEKIFIYIIWTYVNC